jgi:hypothetical protein
MLIEILINCLNFGPVGLQAGSIPESWLLSKMNAALPAAS